MKQETKICQNCQKEFTIEPEDFAFYQKIKVPPPTWCPECRMIRRWVFRNEHFLYKRKDSLTGNLIFSTFSESSPIKVYERDYWWSDNWDPMDYGRDYDWNKPFFEQLKKLSLEVPWYSRSVINLVNSDYCANAGGLKNCYLIFDSGPGTEDCAYGVMVNYSKDSFDNYFLLSSELCYQSFMVQKSYRVFFSSHCQNCQDVYFSQNLVNCQNCFGCVNLRNKQYHIFNKLYSKEEYLEKLKEFNLCSYKNSTKLQKEATDFWLQFPYKFIHGTKNVNVSGDYISYSKNVFYSFLIDGAEDCKYCSYLNARSTKDSYDYNTWGENSELIYESDQVGNNVSRLKFCYMCYPAIHNSQYSIMCGSSSYLFGCIGLRNKQYCILNKQYTKSEYERLVPKIIEHMNKMPYISKIPNSKFQIPNKPQNPNSKSQTREIIYRYGEFFPPELSPFAYNETIAQEYFPLTKEQAIEQGYSWKEPEERDIKIDIKSEQLPDHIKDVDDSIIGKVIQCAHAKFKKDNISVNQRSNQRKSAYGLQPICNEQCTTAFKIIEPELQFYRRMNLPLPRLCPNCRHYQRLKQRNPLKLWHRKCMCGGQTSANGVYKNTIKHFHGTEPCPNEFETTYAPERKEIVYCEKCYLAEVV